MLEIGLIGAPGAGKTKIAGTIASKLLLDVISSPVTRLQLQDIAVGSPGDYIINIEVAMLRHAAIQEKRFTHRPFVTEGTLIDSLAYAGISVEDTQVEVPTTVVRNQLLREMHVATIIACMMLDAQQVDHLFYLPLIDTLDNFAARTDEAIREVIETYHVPVTVVTGDDSAEQIINRFIGSETNAKS